MNAPRAESQTLLFRWAKGRRFSFLAAGLLLFSFFAHAAAFFVFTVVYPARVTIPAPAPQVTVLSPSNPDHQALLRWIEAEDPALVANTASILPPKLLQVEYRPSYQTVRTLPQSGPEPKATLQFPPAYAPLDLIRSVLPPSPAAEPAIERQPTRALVTGPLAARAGATPIPLPLETKATAPLESAQFLIGVSDKGEVRYTFLQTSSGDTAMDTEAARQLGTLTFAPAEAPVAWSVARIFWGDDAYGPDVRE